MVVVQKKIASFHHQHGEAKAPHEKDKTQASLNKIKVSWPKMNTFSFTPTFS
jgi:hypothetical protein